MIENMSEDWNFEDVDKFIEEVGYEQVKATAEAAKAEIFPNPIVTQQWFEKFQRNFREEPLFQRYVTHLGTTLPRNTQAWQAQGERVYAAFCALMVPKITLALKPYVDGVYLTDSVEIDLPTRFQNSVKILSSQVYLWTNEIREMASAMPLPRHTISRELLPYPLMFWSLETAMCVLDPEKEEIIGEIDWIVIQEERDETTGKPNGFGVTTNFNKYSIATNGDTVTEGDYEILYGQVPYGAIYPDDIGEGSHIILALLAFLNTPLLQVTKTRLPRPIRREMKRRSMRKKPTIGDAETNVVTLRHPQTQKSDDPSSGFIYRDHRWWVSGHFRAQWYPSTKDHKLIWIGPHLKGPEDKPILEKTYHVKR